MVSVGKSVFRVSTTAFTKIILGAASLKAASYCASAPGLVKSAISMKLFIIYQVMKYRKILIK